MHNLVSIAYLMAGPGVFFAGVGVLMWGLGKHNKK